MAQMDPDLLSSVISAFLNQRLGRKLLSPAERTEVVRIAQSVSIRESAAMSGSSSETIRHRRKCMYKKLRVAGSFELASSVLGFSLQLIGRDNAAVEQSSAGRASESTQVVAAPPP
jgi:DNA-binding CsgD family transcriptional regulator